MKSRSFLFGRLILPAVALISFSGSAQAATITKAANTTALSTGTSWTGGVVPGVGDIALFDSSSTGGSALTTANSAGISTFGSFQFTNIGALVTIGFSNGGTTTMNYATPTYLIDMSAATGDVTLGGSGSTAFLRWASGAFNGISVASGRTLTINTNISNAGSTKTIAMTGGGNIIFNGASNGGGGAMGFSIQGGTNVTMAGTGGWSGGSLKEVINGTLNLASDTALGSAALGLGGTNASTPTITASGGARTIANNVNLLAVAVAGNATIAGSNDLTINGVVTQSGANRTLSITNSGVTTFGTGGLALSESASNRTLNINGAGTLNITGAVVNGSTSTTSALTYSGTGTMTLSNASNTFGGTLSVSSGTVSLTGGLTAASVSTSGTGLFTQSSTGSIAGAGGFTQGSSSTSVLGNANTYSGTTTISAGALRIDNSLAVQNSTVSNGITNGLVFGSGVTTATLGGLSGAGDLAFTNTGAGNVSASIGNNNANTTYSGTLSGGGGSFTKIGNGTLTLSGTTSGSMTVNLNVGTLGFGNIQGSGVSAVSAANGTTVFAGANGANTTVSVTGTNANVTLTNNSASSGFNAASGFTGSSDQTLTISNAGGTVVNMSATNNKQLQNFLGTVDILSGASLGFRATSLNNGGDNTLFNVNGTLTTRNNGSVALGALSGSGTVGSGTSGTAGTSVTYTIGARGTNTTFSGVIQNGDATHAVNVIKTGSGIQTLSGISTYTGTTSVRGGSLVIGTSGALGNSAVTVGGNNSSSTPTLAGGGTIGGATIIASAGSGVSGTHSVGVAGVANGVGTQTFSSTLEYQTGSIFAWDLNAASASDPGVVADAATGTYDKVVASGAVTGSGATFNIVLGGNSFSDAFWTSNKSWTDIFSGSGTPGDLALIFTTFGGSGVSSLGSVSGVTGGVGQFTFNGSTLNYNFSAVPEPTSALAGLLIGAGLLRRRRVA